MRNGMHRALEVANKQLTLFCPMLLMDASIFGTISVIRSSASFSDSTRCLFFTSAQRPEPRGGALAQLPSLFARAGERYVAVANAETTPLPVLKDLAMRLVPCGGGFSWRGGRP